MTPVLHDSCRQLVLTDYPTPLSLPFSLNTITHALNRRLKDLRAQILRPNFFEIFRLSFFEVFQLGFFDSQAHSTTTDIWLIKYCVSLSLSLFLSASLASAVIFQN
ncbi:unnamed protein product [Ilex paraguariensis]|uniref:Uncharacterized protein n=1 Tax=Ilex paraguariensis TaxID=185542 RepID=A0ABC8T2V6_9AQUA